jgi:ERCC4-type nuclease
MTVELIIDSRERALLAQLNTSGIAFTQKTLECGDIIITKDGKPQIIIERKTIQDYADSLFDNRINNYFNLLKYRDMHGCKIAFIIEGYQDLAFTAHNYLYRDLLAHMNKLQFTHNIMMILYCNYPNSVNIYILIVSNRLITLHL